MEQLKVWPADQKEWHYWSLLEMQSHHRHRIQIYGYQRGWWSGGWREIRSLELTYTHDYI